MDWIFKAWPWYVSGPLIAAVMFMLIFMDRQFGMSSNLRTMCSILGGGKRAAFFRFNWKEQRWNLLVMTGAALGGFIGAFLLSEERAVNIHPDTIVHLKELGFASAGEAYLPEMLFSIEALTNVKSVILLVTGGFLIGFGSRYSGGCTSGHAISGLSNLQLPSLIAVIGFFVGGLIMVHILFPLIF